MLSVWATAATDLIRTHGNGQEKIHIHLMSRIRNAHGLDTHTRKRSFKVLSTQDAYVLCHGHGRIFTACID